MNTLLQQEVTAQAEARPEKTALVHNGVRMTYAELEQTSNRLAHLLRGTGCRRGDRIGLVMPKAPAAILAMLAALKADAIYVPMDPASPPARQARVLEISDCRCILAAGPVAPSLDAALAAAALREPPMLGWLDAEPPDAAAFSLRDLAAFPATTPRYANDENDAAHILFTS